MNHDTANACSCLWAWIGNLGDRSRSLATNRERFPGGSGDTNPVVISVVAPPSNGLSSIVEKTSPVMVGSFSSYGEILCKNIHGSQRI